MTRSQVRYKKLQDKLDEVSDELDATAQLAIQTSVDFADPGVAVVFFPHWSSKQKWLGRYRKVTLGAGLKCWQAPRGKVFLLRYSCIRPLSNVSKTWLNRSPRLNAKMQPCTAQTSVGPCNLSATATSLQAARRQKSLGLFSPRTMPVMGEQAAPGQLAVQGGGELGNCMATAQESGEEAYTEESNGCA